MSWPRQTVTHLDANELSANPANLREELGDITELAMSIREHGILQPLTVTEDESGGYVLLSGHRRLAAGLRCGLTTYPVIVRHGVTDQSDQVVVMLVENIHRKDLNPIERAHAFEALLNRGMTRAEVARQVGCVHSNVTKYLTLLDLPIEEQDAIRLGSLSSSHAVEQVREQRQQQRAAAGRPLMGAPVKTREVSESAEWFSSRHRLARDVASMCGHDSRPLVGGIGCGQCWESAIRNDGVDDVAIDRRMAGDKSIALTVPESIELVRRWKATGRSLNECERVTGLNPGRYPTDVEVHTAPSTHAAQEAS